MKKRTLLLATISLLSLPLSGQAQVIAIYDPTDFDHGQYDVSPGPTLAPIDVDPNLNAGSLMLGPVSSSIARFANSAAGSSGGFGMNMDSNNNTSLSYAVDNSVYMTFTLAPSAGNTLTVLALDLSGSNIGNATFYVESNITGFGTDAGNILTQFTLPANGGILDLSENTSFQNLAGPVEFRIYDVQPSAFAQDVLGTSGGIGPDFDQSNPANYLTVYGTLDSASVPEPSSYAMLGMGLLGLALMLNRRQSLAI